MATLLVDKAYISSSWTMLPEDLDSLLVVKQIPIPSYVELDERGVLRAVYKWWDNI